MDFEFRVMVPDKGAGMVTLAHRGRRSSIPSERSSLRFENGAFPDGVARFKVTNVNLSQTPSRVTLHAGGVPLDTFLAAGWKPVHGDTPGSD